MSTGLIEMRVQTPSTDVNQRASDGTQGQVTQSPATLASDDPDCTEARAYGAAFVKVLGPGSTWEEVEPLIRNGWASRHNEVCDTRYDWRLSWPVVKHGWRGAGGAFDLLSPPEDSGDAHGPVATAIHPGDVHVSFTPITGIVPSRRRS